MMAVSDHENDAVDLEEDVTICPMCRSIILAAYFIALFVLSYGDCFELWAAIQHVKALGDIGY